jgi:hypothetical protein
MEITNMKKINDFAQMIAQVQQNKTEKIPEGFKTIETWAKENNMSNSYAAINIQEGFKAGLMEKKEFRIKTGAGVRAVAHYKIIK